MSLPFDPFFRKHNHLYRYDGLFAYSEVRFHKWFEEFEAPVYFDGGKYRNSKVDAILALSTVLDLENNLHKEFYYRPYEFGKKGGWNGFSTCFRNHCLYLYAEHKKNTIYSGTKLYKIKQKDYKEIQEDYSVFFSELYDFERDKNPNFMHIEKSLVENEPTFKVDYELAIVDEVERTFAVDILNINNRIQIADYNLSNVKA